MFKVRAGLRGQSVFEKLRARTTSSKFQTPPVLRSGGPIGVRRVLLLGKVGCGWTEPLPLRRVEAPKKHQVPSSKHQTPNTREAPSSKLEARAVVWSLELGISLVFGAWCLVFQFWNFSGAWGLVLGVLLGGANSAVDTASTFVSLAARFADFTDEP
jgi:hypothetical protein